MKYLKLKNLQSPGLLLFSLLTGCGTTAPRSLWVYSPPVGMGQSGRLIDISNGSRQVSSNSPVASKAFVIPAYSVNVSLLSVGEASLRENENIPDNVFGNKVSNIKIALLYKGHIENRFAQKFNFPYYKKDKKSECKYVRYCKIFHKNINKSDAILLSQTIDGDGAKLTSPLLYRADLNGRSLYIECEINAKWDGAVDLNNIRDACSKMFKNYLSIAGE